MEPERPLTHIGEDGSPRMVDVGGKPETQREAVAEAFVRMSGETLDAVKAGAGAKGDIFTTSRLAGIMGAKKTSELIPLCHPLSLDDIDVSTEVTDEGIVITSRVKTTARTGVEMEALTAATIAALTVYDMCKSVDKGISIENVRLVKKSGGKSGDWKR
jgi:cyclic pyranopterin phosphate synthase